MLQPALIVLLDNVDHSGDQKLRGGVRGEGRGGEGMGRGEDSSKFVMVKFWFLTMLVYNKKTSHLAIPKQPSSYQLIPPEPTAAPTSTAVLISGLRSSHGRRVPSTAMSLLLDMRAGPTPAMTRESSSSEARSCWQ